MLSTAWFVRLLIRGATIAQWIHLRLPSYCPKFKSQAHNLCFNPFIFELCFMEKDENKQKKEAGIGPLKNKQSTSKIITRLPTHFLDISSAEMLQCRRAQLTVLNTTYYYLPTSVFLKSGRN